MATQTTGQPRAKRPRKPRVKLVAPRLPPKEISIPIATVARKRLEYARRITDLSGNDFSRLVWSGECLVKLRDGPTKHSLANEDETETMDDFKIKNGMTIKLWAAVYGDGSHSPLFFIPRIHPHCQLRPPPEQGEWRAEQAKKVRESVTEFIRGRASTIQPSAAYGLPCPGSLSESELDALEKNYHEISSQSDLRRLIPSWQKLDTYGDELLRAIQAGLSRHHSSETSRDFRLCPNTASYIEMLELGLDDSHQRNAILVHDNHPARTSQMMQNWLAERNSTGIRLPDSSSGWNRMNFVWPKLKEVLEERNPGIWEERNWHEQNLPYLQYIIQSAWNSIPSEYFKACVKEEKKHLLYYISNPPPLT